MKFIDYWDFFKTQFTYGIDYIDVDASDYIAICVSTFEVMNKLFNSGFKMWHCTVQNKKFMREQFILHALNKDEKGIKVFYFLKETDIDQFKNLTSVKEEIEFCGWIKPNTHKKILYHFCDVKNNHSKTSDDEIIQFVGYVDFGRFDKQRMWRYPDMTLARKAIQFSYDNIILEIDKYRDKFYNRIKNDIENY